MSPDGELDFLPHGKECRYLDAILSRTESSIRCRVAARTVDPAVGPEIPSAIGVEYLAQASALLCGDERSQPAVGVIASVRSLRCFQRTLLAGTHLVAGAELLSRDASLAVFQCELRDESSESLVMDGRIAIAFLKDRP